MNINRKGPEKKRRKNKRERERGIKMKKLLNLSKFHEY